MKKILVLFVFCGSQIECVASKNMLSFFWRTSRDKRHVQVFEDHAPDLRDALEWMSGVSMHIDNYRIQFQQQKEDV